MRKEDLTKLEQPYENQTKESFDNRFGSAIGADVPSANKLVKEIFDDLDETTFGVNWWTSLPTEERILISDYLYQCVFAIETNLAEAKLHFLEFLDARERINKFMANSVSIDSNGDPQFKHPPALKPIDSLSNKLEALHICGFFRAIGSVFDCLGSTIIGVLALPINLRKGDIGRAEKELSKIKNSGVFNLQADFFDFYENAKKINGSIDWIEWTDQYRNMFVHRGRQTSYSYIKPNDVKLYDLRGKIIPRTQSVTHLSKYPDRTDVEGLIKSIDIMLNEDASITLNGIFNSTREFVEMISQELVNIWQKRRNAPTLLEQPEKQWNDQIRNCSFTGFVKNSCTLNIDLFATDPTLRRRMLSASLFEYQRSLWRNSKWS